MSGLRHQGKSVEEAKEWRMVRKHAQLGRGYETFCLLSKAFGLYIIYVENRDMQHLTELLSSCVTHINNLQHLNWELYWNHKCEWFTLLLTERFYNHCLLAWEVFVGLKSTLTVACRDGCTCLFSMEITTEE